MWEGNEQSFRRFEKKISELVLEEGFDEMIIDRVSAPDLRAKARWALKRDEDGCLTEPIILKITLR